VRAPGSGSEGTGDLLLLRGDICFPIEVKSSKKKKLYLSGRTVLQYQALEEIGRKCSIQPFYAYRLKGVRGDSWKIFRVKVEGLTGKSRLLARRVPELPLTRNGTPYLDWDKGLPLHKFLSFISKSESAKNIESSMAPKKIYSEILDSVTSQYDSSSPDRAASSLSNS
jgi:Holliday junction resolvase